MNEYKSPEINVTLFANDEIITASTAQTPSKTPGGGVSLPDDDWTV